MNPATLIGLLVGVIVLVWAGLSSVESAAALLNPYGLAMVLGGTLAAALVCYPLKALLRVLALLPRVLRQEELPIGDYIREIIYLANQEPGPARPELRLERRTGEERFIGEGLRMLADGYPAQEMEAVFKTRIENILCQGRAQARILRTMARLSAGFGLIAALVGLITAIHSLGTGSAERLGPELAQALASALYGLVLAFLVFHPLAVKVEGFVEERVLLRRIVARGLLLVRDETPPPLILDKLKAHLPSRRWGSIKPRQQNG